MTFSGVLTHVWGCRGEWFWRIKPKPFTPTTKHMRHHPWKRHKMGIFFGGYWLYKFPYLRMSSLGFLSGLISFIYQKSNKKWGWTIVFSFYNFWYNTPTCTVQNHKLYSLYWAWVRQIPYRVWCMLHRVQRMIHRASFQPTFAPQSIWFITV